MSPTQVPRLRDLAGDDLARAQANALRCCACRETFEETGILLARQPDGSPHSAESLLRLRQGRGEMLADAARFYAALAAEGLVIAADALIYWGHWVTPAPA